MLCFGQPFVFVFSLASLTPFLSHLWLLRHRPSAQPGSSAVSHPAETHPVTSLERLLQTICWRCCKTATERLWCRTHIPDVVFGDAVVNIRAVGPVDNNTRGGVAEKQKNKNRIQICRRGRKKMLTNILINDSLIWWRPLPLAVGEKRWLQQHFQYFLVTKRTCLRDQCDDAPSHWCTESCSLLNSWRFKRIFLTAHFYATTLRFGQLRVFIFTVFKKLWMTTNKHTRYLLMTTIVFIG